jgi:hypothetical protein
MHFLVKVDVDNLRFFWYIHGVVIHSVPLKIPKFVSIIHKGPYGGHSWTLSTSSNVVLLCTFVLFLCDGKPMYNCMYSLELAKLHYTS